ncbi:hypothetical protein [Neptunicella sp. SCSIO 80796]|uniref:hypothetical protein n=1 Tax=Neptunicella plasticusilytica TaxID=3117012 RepID=UPI003A4D2AC1
MEFIINEATFSLPCRSFVIDYAVSERRKLAVVKEFTIRLLYALKGISPERVANYFGFTVEETQIVLASLQEERLIKWVDGQVELTTYAYDRFEEVKGRAEPRFFEVEDKVDSVTFDLLTFKLIAESSSGSISPTNMEIPLPNNAMNNLVKKAKSAFDKQFNTFVEKLKGIDTYSNPIELYKINQVYNRNDRLVPVRIQYVVTDETASAPSIRYVDEWMEEWDEDKSLYSAICEQTESVGIAQTNIGVALDEYVSLTRDPIILNFFRKDRFDFCAALKTFESNKGIFELETRMLVGNFYLDHNRELIHSLLDYKFGNEAKVPGKGILWNIEPSDKVWGRCPDAESFLQSLEQRLDERKRPLRTVMTIKVNSKSDSFKVKERYGIFRCDFQGLNKHIGNSQVEILLIPGVLVACSFHFILENNYPLTLPIGFVTTAEDRITNVENALRQALGNPAHSNEYFEKFDVERDNTVLESKIFKILGG